MDIDKLYLEYCGHNPEEVTWEFRNCMKYKIFHDAANIVIAEMKKTCGGCCNGEERVAILEKAVNELEATKKVQEENERLKKDSEENQDLATAAYMQGAGKNKAKLDEAREIIKKLVEGIRIISDPKVELTDVDVFVAKAEAFLKESGE